MKPKKTEKADVDKKSGLYFRIGLAISLALSILAFEWTQYDKTTVDLSSNLVLDEEEEVADITKQDQPPPQAPPPAAPPEIEIVEDNVKVDNTNQLQDVEANEQQAIEIPVLQEEKETVVEEEIFFVVEDMPTFPGGEVALQKYLKDNIRYPEIERDNGIQGLVVVSFVVEKDGSVNKVEILKGVTPNINDEAIRVIKAMPKWSPGKQRGKPVRVTINVPIRFTLQ
ncbi:MAG TPA: energy transducer TonB [Bacteroidia bacterium]|nr:energy transducer TonB [Sphingobacteriales bacterium]HPD64760.1 energy transducer TonB [Bacteroidia bacterium]HRS59340.1 energy transducer TonB [Bacteroidia bacterium]HRU67210.1 energy transducer TonB [Bacteroidia bacterium]